MAETRIHCIWRKMKERCYNKNFKFYNRYGGRGIVVCDEWLKFKPFEEWCLKSGYSDNLTLDKKTVGITHLIIASGQHIKNKLITEYLMYL